MNVTARVTANDGLVLREGASTESKQIDTIPYGTNVNIISLKDNYYYGRYDDLMVKVDYNGKQGYVCSYFLLVDNEIDISKYSAEQKYAFGSLLYSQTDSLSSKFVLGTGLLDCTYTNERFENYVKLLPAGLTINQLSDDYYKYFSKNKPYDFDSYFLEKDGYLWKKTGFGLEPDGSYDEITEMVSASSNTIKYKATHFDNPVYSIREPEEHDFEICFEDNRWKVSDSFYYTNMPY